MKSGDVFLILGGTGSLGKTLVRKLLANEVGAPAKVIVFSRDEAKQHFMRLEYVNQGAGTDDIAYRSAHELLDFQIGDVRNYASVAAAVARADVVVYAAALKQVPSCEYAPDEAVLTNVLGAQNVVRAVRETRNRVRIVVGVSTDKACKPINVMGMTKALQERVFAAANLHSDIPHLAVRYGNVMASRGSVLPLFAQQILGGGPLTLTTPEMTRFLLSLDDAADTIFHALRHPLPGAVYVPRVKAARLVDVAAYLIGDRGLETTVIGIRPGEKIHEVLISAEEAPRTYTMGDYFVVLPMLPELRKGLTTPDETLGKELNSGDFLMSAEELAPFLKRQRVTVEEIAQSGEVLR